MRREYERGTLRDKRVREVETEGERSKREGDRKNGVRQRET